MQEDYVSGHTLVFESLSIYRKLDDKLGLASVLLWLGVLVDTKDDVQTRRYLVESLALYRSLEFPAGIAITLTWLGRLELRQENFLAVRACLVEALEIQNSFGRPNAASVLEVFGELAMREGNYEEAKGYLEESISLAELNGRIIISHWLNTDLGYVTLRLGDYVRARELLIKAITGFNDIGVMGNAIYALEGLASLAVVQKQFTSAAQLFAWADTVHTRSSFFQVNVDRDLALTRARLDDVTFDAAQAAGRAMTMDEAIAFALNSTKD
jgi:tetratricopeptide (TPR) repeat protein